MVWGGHQPVSTVYELLISHLLVGVLIIAYIQTPGHPVSEGLAF